MVSTSVPIGPSQPPSRRSEIANFWDHVVSDFYMGVQVHIDDAPLRRWFTAYVGSGRGSVTTEAFPEPYIGPLSPDRGNPKVVTLGLNPGEANLKFQGRDGVFEHEMISTGSYAAWAATAPYLREPWRSENRHNRYHADLLTFAQRWTHDYSLRSEDVLVFELYPWHSDKVTRPIRPDPQLIESFIWEPLAEIDTDIVFAFGKPWVAVAENLHLHESFTVSQFAVADRRLRAFSLPSGQRLAVVWQPLYSGPPGEKDVEALRDALEGRSHQGASKPAALAAENDRAIHGVRPSVSSTTSDRARTTRSTASTDARVAHMKAIANYAREPLIRWGFDPRGVPANGGFMPVRWPMDLWYKRYTQDQRNLLHLKVSDGEISLRVHVDAFHGDRVRNNAAFDILRGDIEEDLLAELPMHKPLNWRAASGGDNQVCAVTTNGGVAANDPGKDSEWIVDVATAWLRVLRRHHPRLG